MVVRYWRRVERLFGRTCSRQAVRHNRIRRGVERHSDMRAWNFKIRFFLSGHAIAPIDDAVLARVNRGLHHRVRTIPVEGIDEIAGAAPRVAIGKHAAAMLLQDSQANRLSRLKHSFVGHSAAKWRRQGYHRGDIPWPLMRDRARNHSSEAMTDQM